MVPSARRQICSNANPNNKRLKKQDQTKEDQEQAVDTLLPHLPDLIVDKIFRLIPTKHAIRSAIVSKQWASVWSLGVPFLDFNDEGDSDDRRKLLFVDFVESCLRHYEKNKLLESDSFRLRMRYDCELIDSTRINKWFSFVVSRCVKELDISIQRDWQYYGLPHTILNAQYLTRLNLEHVAIRVSADLISLPLLKTMTLNVVHWSMNLDRSLWKGCPSIEHLSLDSCSFASLAYWGQIVVKNSSLKFLQVMYCMCLSIQVEAENLESFILTSEFPGLASIDLLGECVKLKYISVYAQHSNTRFGMHGKCRDNLKATIYISNLVVFNYTGYVLSNDVISVKAQKPFIARLKLDWDDEQVFEPIFLPPRTHFLHNFDCCNLVGLDIQHDAIVEALTFPENFRKTFSPPLLKVKNLTVSLVSIPYPLTEARYSALTDSLRWMAPKAWIDIDLQHQMHGFRSTYQPLYDEPASPWNMNDYSCYFL
ncbi:hypothetical protein ACLB2K_008635 [Fragaria x ananassa]